ncbi:hypothetical protein W02_00870 [Nitrospira sp. KM1]|uniref:hypothetical protein n=1 Tax=Nitrospira sp. KM1 TaxID=1936990 RepID=UPI0013A739F5|nr:hypothetical protein [Nitrospira sp. KM1]BCA52947.1 hypothetical protein W02_00870 [Nitrospira sp. KM1]
MRAFLVAPLVFLLPGCIWISTEFPPINPEVKKLREVSDCVPIIFGFGFGTASYEEAMKKPSAAIGHQPGTNSLKLTKVRGYGTGDYQFLMFGAKCVEVTGESDGSGADPIPLMPPRF